MSQPIPRHDRIPGHDHEDFDDQGNVALGWSGIRDAVVRRAAADPFIAGAVVATGLSLGLYLARRPRAASFVGLVVPTLLLAGAYRGVVDLAAASDRRCRHADASESSERFEGGCASPPAEWTEEIDSGVHMSAARDPDDYSEPTSRVAPLKAK